MRHSAQRREDMSPDGWMQVGVQNDGDVVVSFQGRNCVGEPVLGCVEFCALGAGGGRSPHTRVALEELLAAMEKDNQENPIPE